MPSIPFALSVHHFISSVGADAGFASLIGLALLVLLYFAHARETATLRSRADEAGLRVQELEAQLADLADQIAGLPAEISVRAAGSRVVAASGGVQQRVAAGVIAQGSGQAGLSRPAPAPSSARCRLRPAHLRVSRQARVAPLAAPDDRLGRLPVSLGLPVGSPARARVVQVVRTGAADARVARPDPTSPCGRLRGAHGPGG